MRVPVDFAAESFACWEIASQHQLKDRQTLPALQSYLARASLLTLVIELYKVLEKRTDTHNFYQLVEYARQDGIISDPDAWLDIIENTLKPTWETIKSLRHKFYAHLDDKKSPRQLILETNFVPSDFRVLLDGYDSFLEKMAHRIGQKQTAIKVKEDLIRAELKRILDALKARAGSS
jgi:hypothetical protein